MPTDNDVPTIDEIRNRQHNIAEHRRNGLITFGPMTDEVSIDILLAEVDRLTADLEAYALGAAYDVQSYWVRKFANSHGRRPTPSEMTAAQPIYPSASKREATLLAAYTWTPAETRMPEAGTGPWLVRSPHDLAVLYAGASQQSWAGKDGYPRWHIEETEWCAMPHETEESTGETA